MRSITIFGSLFVLAFAAAPPSAADEPADKPAVLAQDPALLSGRLENGLKYLCLRHAIPEGRISLWLHVSSGSLNETEEQRGLAHYLEHMAFNGSKNFPPGSVVPFFQSMGLSFGRDQNAFTSFDQTTYQLALPDTKAATVEKGLLYLSDVAFRLLLPPTEIEAERSIILEERRTGLGPQQRLRDFVLERLAPGSLVGKRMPIGTEERIKGVQEKDFKDYYSTWYVASNMTVLAVGDADMATIAKAIEKAFGEGAKVPAPVGRDAGVVLPTTQRAIVATDKDMTAGEISIACLSLPRPPRRTVADVRAALVEDVGERILQRRVESALAAGKVSFREGRVSSNDLGRALRAGGLDAGGQPARWKEMLGDAVLLVEQARRHGFSERELSDARTALLADAEDDVRRTPTRPARAVLQRMNRTVAREEPVLSPEQTQDLLKTLLPGLSTEEVAAAFRARFDPARLTFVVRLPASEGVPTEEQVLAAGREALTKEPPKPVDEARPTSFLEKAPEPGKVEAEEVHEAAKVWSAWYANGLRAHHRRDESRKNEATVVVTLAGGEVEETAKTRGSTEAGVLAWTLPAATGLSSTMVRDLLVGKNVRVRGSSGSDALALTISGDPRDLEVGLQLAHRLLTDPVVEGPALDQWKEGQAQEIKSRRSRPAAALQVAVGETFFPGVAAEQPLRDEDLARITKDGAQEWLRARIQTAPIEVAVVGDVDRATAQALVAKYLGSLPARARIGPTTLAEARKAQRPKGPLEAKRTVQTETQQAIVLDGFFGPDVQDVASSRRLSIASRLLSTRMTAEIREQKQLVYSIRAAFRPGTDRPGFGQFAAQAPTDPAKVAALGSALEALYAAFAKDGPTDEELTVAKKQMANTIDEAMKSPDFWIERLQDLDYRGLSLNDTMAAPGAYQALTKEEVREGFARWYVPEARFRITVSPGSDG